MRHAAFNPQTTLTNAFFVPESLVNIANTSFRYSFIWNASCNEFTNIAVQLADGAALDRADNLNIAAPQSLTLGM